MEYTPTIWRNLNMRDLKVDEAYVILETFTNLTYLYSRSDECYMCPFTKLGKLKPHSNENKILRLNVVYNHIFRLFNKDMGRYELYETEPVCQVELKNLQEFGVYNFTVDNDNICHFMIDKPGVNVNLSLLTIFLLITSIAIIFKIIVRFWRTLKNHNNEADITNTTDIIPSEDTNSVQHKRLHSLDVFRGLAIVLMIFVNGGGGHYWWIKHATWNGLHIADTVFPAFIWIMGVSLHISIQSQRRRGASKHRICLKILKRSIKLFVLGLCLNSLNGPNMSDLRIMGVLQRFSVAYLLCGLLHTLFFQYSIEMRNWQRNIPDLVMMRYQLFICLCLIFMHLAIIFFIKVPNCPKGYFGPGGKYNYPDVTNCTGGVSGFIDLKILGESHIYQHFTGREIYDSTPFDPEGIFGCILTTVQVFLGILTGVIMFAYTDHKARITRWLLWSLFLGIIAEFLCGFSIEGGLIPINKNLWSLSFICATTAICFMGFSFFYYIIDIRKWWSGKTLQAAGMNAIIMYIGHTIMHKMLPWHWRIGAMNTHFILMLEAIWNTTLWIFIAVYFDHKKFYYNI